MKLTSDWHIHSCYSHDSAAMTMPDLVRNVEGKGVCDYGVADHFHTRYNLPDIAASYKAFWALPPSPHFHFGVEVSCVSKWEIDEIATGKYKNPVIGLRSGGPSDSPLAIDLSIKDIETYKIEYVIGSSHWPINTSMEIQGQIREHHRQNMFLVCNPLVDIVGHPWYWKKNLWGIQGNCFSAIPWFGEFHKIPKSMHNEFAAAAVEHGTIVEINLRANVLRSFDLENYNKQYLEYMAYLKSQGVTLCLGSDCHSAQYEINLGKASLMLKSVGIMDKDLWKLPPRIL